MQLVAWWGWTWEGESPDGVSQSQQVILPPGHYSAFCGLTVAGVEQYGVAFEYATCGIDGYRTVGGIPVDAPAGPGWAFLFPTEDLEEFVWGAVAGPRSKAAAYVYVSGWE